MTGRDTPSVWDEGEGEDDVVGLDAVRAPVQEIDGGISKTYAPWHLARKHYCRIWQWCQNVDGLGKILKLGGEGPTSRSLRYMSLPGDELLDIRTLHGLAARRKFRIRFLGFNSAMAGDRKEEADLSFSEVRALGSVEEEHSLVVQERLERLVDEQSLSRRRFEEFGPFDVVNLDLCDSVVGRDPTSSATLKAIRLLVDRQMNRRREPWLLFVTSRFGRKVSNDETARMMWSALAKNVEEDEFANALASELDFDAEQVRTEATGEDVLEDAVYARGSSLAFAKWLLGFVASRTDGWEVDLLDCFCYRVENTIGYPDMFSMCFRLSTIDQAGHDVTGLTQSAVPQRRTEVEMGVEALCGVAKTCDVDSLLKGDVEAHKKVIKQAVAILAQARHNAEEYLAWYTEQAAERDLGPVPVLGD